MTTLSPVVAHVTTPTAQDEQNRRAPVEYGAAVTHRDFIREKLRVDPISVAAKNGAHTEPKRSDPRKDESNRRGQHVDIQV